MFFSSSSSSSLFLLANWSCTEIFHSQNTKSNKFLQFNNFFGGFFLLLFYFHLSFSFTQSTLINGNKNNNEKKKQKKYRCENFLLIVMIRFREIAAYVLICFFVFRYDFGWKYFSFCFLLYVCVRFVFRLFFYCRGILLLSLRQRSKKTRPLAIEFCGLLTRFLKSLLNANDERANEWM